jgi:S1-C subfamily serine protease
MGKGLVIHIGDGDEQRVEIWAEDRLRLGVGRECDVRVGDEIWENASVELELVKQSGRFRLAALQSDAPLSYRQRPLAIGDWVDDGGAVRVGDSPLAVRFLPVSDSSTALISADKNKVAPFIQEAALESAASGERTDAIFFLRELGRELWRELSFKTKAAFVGVPVLLAVGITILGVGIYRERRQSLDTIAQQSQRITEQNQQLTTLQQQLGATDERISALDRSQQGIQQNINERASLPQRLWRDYHKGVCLIAGVYQLLDPRTGRPLRYPESNVGEEGEVVTGGAPPQLTTEGQGTLAEYDFVGTGFYAGNGFLLTNRHVVQPWTVGGDKNLPGRPNIKALRAYFPGRRDAVSLQVKAVGQEQDLAVCALSGAVTDLPALPLAAGQDVPPVGAQVTMMGYPSGPDRLLSLLSDKEAQALQQRSSSLDALLRRLSELNLVKPLTTQGNITDTYKERVVFDAATSAGGSGGPIFGPAGRVVGVSFGVFTENSASNFGVPVASALALLERAGWRNPAATDTGVAVKTP